MNKKIFLIADDDEMNRMIIRKFLKNDYDVIEAMDGKEAMDILHSKHVDALLLDIIMPEMDGLEVLEAISKEPKLESLGVLVATSTKEKTEREALSLGADDVVSKPYDPVVIKRRMENILAMKSMRKQQLLMANNDTEALNSRYNQELSNQLETSVNKIVKYAEIIKSNKGNVELVDEIASEIKLEAENVKLVIVEG